MIAGSDDTAAGRYQPFPPFADWASLDVDRTVYDAYAGILDRLRAQTEPARLERAVRTATRLAAIDTGAIEGLYEVDRGFTMTVAAEAAAWEAAIDAREPVVRRSFEDALRAYDFVLDIATGRTEISEKAIKEIHALICASQEAYHVWTSVGRQEQPLPKGKYKTLPNNPTRTATGRVHTYAPPADTPAEMDRLVRELRSPEFGAAHPVLQAAYAHYSFVAIHPFADGNGRVARALASAYLYRRPGVPLVIFADQKDEYLDALEAADDGNLRAFVRFVEARVADIVGIVEVATAQPDAPSSGTSLASLREAFIGREGLPLDELNAVAYRIQEAAVAEILKQLEQLTLPAGIRAVRDEYSDIESPSLDPEYRWPAHLRSYIVGLTGHGLWATKTLYVAVRRSDVDGPAFLLFLNDSRKLHVELRDAYPSLAAVFSIKLQLWTDGLVRNLLAELEAEARKAYRTSEPPQAGRSGEA
jgi:Fic family protein